MRMVSVQRLLGGIILPLLAVFRGSMSVVPSSASASSFSSSFTTSRPNDAQHANTVNAEASHDQQRPQQRPQQEQHHQHKHQHQLRHWQRTRQEQDEYEQQQQQQQQKRRWRRLSDQEEEAEEGGGEEDEPDDSLRVTACPTMSGMDSDPGDEAERMQELMGYTSISDLLQDWKDNVTDTFVLCPGIEFQTTSAMLVDVPHDEHRNGSESGTESENENENENENGGTDDDDDENNDNDNNNNAQIRVIKCAGPDQTCVWNAIGTHLHIAPAAYLDLTVAGIKFKSSTTSSILLEAPPTVPLFVRFANCSWEANKGEATIEVIPQSAPSGQGEDDTTGDRRQLRRLDDDSPLTYNTVLTIERATFEYNTALDSIISVSQVGGTQLQVRDTLFQNNSPQRSVIANGGGENASLSMSDVSFVHNTVSRGIILVGSGSAVENATDVCGSNNTATEIPSCNGTFTEDQLDPDGEECSSENQDACDSVCSAIDECQDDDDDDGGNNSTACYDSWQDLQDAINNVTASDTTDNDDVSSTAAEFTVCAGSKLEVASSSSLSDDAGPLELEGMSVWIRCGPEGDRKDDCTVWGGAKHVVIRSASSDAMPPTSVRLQGLTFQKAKGQSIDVEWSDSPPSDSSVVLEDCLWKFNEGDSIVRISSSKDEEKGSLRARRSLADVQSTSTSTIDLTQCDFTANIATKSIVIHDSPASNMTLANCTFQENSAEDSIVAAVRGVTHLGGVVLEDNEVGIGVIFAGVEANYTADVICGQDNSATNVCNGTYMQVMEPEDCASGDNSGCNPACSDLPTQCDGTPTEPGECHSTWEALSDAVATGTEDEQIFEICAGSILEVTDSDEPIAIETPIVSFRCGADGNRDDECSVTGGKRHFRIEEGATSVSFQGILFENAEELSVEMSPTDATELAHVAFRDCQWSDNRGEAAVRVAMPNGRVQNDRPELSVNLTECDFIANVVTGSIIKNEAANLLVRDADFLENEAGRSLIEVITGNNEMDMITVRRNAVTMGTIYVGLNADVNQTGLCETDNTVEENDGCTGILFQVKNRAACFENSAPDCRSSCTDLEECEQDDDDNEKGDDDDDDDSDSDCYSDWGLLVAECETSKGGETFSVCPNTTFLLNASSPPLYMNASDTILRCGANGDHADNCLVEGGEVQVCIFGAPTGIRLEGMTFIGSNASGVSAYGDHTAEATLESCVFSNHKGTAAVMNLNAATVSETRRGVLVDLKALDLPPNANSSMTVKLHDCAFSENVVELAPFVNVGGNASVEECRFENNEGEAGGILSIFESFLEVSKSCFVDNQGSLSGSIALREEAVLLSHVDNHGDGNEASSGDCSGVLLANETCNDFELSECYVDGDGDGDGDRDGGGGGGDDDDDESDVPSMMPSLSPTLTSSESLPSSDSSDKNQTCFSDWEMLYNAVNASTGGEVLVVCEHTTFNLDDYNEDGLVPLLISSNMTISCETPSRATCVLQGGERHIAILGDVDDVLIRGFEFRNASQLSVMAEVTIPIAVEFENCEWYDNEGNSTLVLSALNSSNMKEEKPDDDVLIDGGISGEDENSTSDSGNDDFLIGGRTLVEQDDASFLCDRCSFVGNTAGGDMISAQGLVVLLEASEFDDNAVNSSLIHVEGGMVYISSSCMSGNEFDSDVGLVSGDDTSEIIQEDNFGRNNSAAGGNSDCDGLAVGSSCDTFESATCVAVTKKCFDDLTGLSEELRLSTAAGVAATFTLCEDVVFDFDNEAPLVIEVSGTRLRCGFSAVRANNCIFVGGDIQVEIRGSPTDVELRGISFIGASTAAVRASGDADGNATVIDCVFADIDGGVAAVIAFDGDFPDRQGAPNATSSDFPPPTNASMSIDIRYSLFRNNTVDLAPLSTFGGNLSVTSGQFEDNAGEVGAVGGWSDARVILTESCFSANTGSVAGSVFADNASSISESDSFGELNTEGSSQCADILIDAECTQFSATECLAGDAPTGAPTPPPGPTVAPETPCFSNWAELSEAVENRPGDTIAETVLRLCRDTIFDVDNQDPIVIDGSGEVLFQCGSEGELEDNCIVLGGEMHFRIRGNVGRVAFAGIQLAESTVAAVIAEAANSSQAAFERCKFTNHQGSAVVLIYNGDGNANVTELLNNQTNLTELSDSPSGSMAVGFDSCEFLENNVTLAAVVNMGGSSTFFGTLFVDNTNAHFGVVSVSATARLAISTSCFVENESDLPGSVFLTAGGEVALNEKNFKLDIRAGDCDGIFKASNHTCSVSNCSGTCEEFEAMECEVPGTDFVAKTDAPSTAPTERSPFDFSPQEFIQELQDAKFARSSWAKSGSFFRTLTSIVLVIVGAGGAYFYLKKKFPAPKTNDNSLDEAPSAHSARDRKGADEKPPGTRNMFDRTDSDGSLGAEGDTSSRDGGKRGIGGHDVNRNSNPYDNRSFDSRSVDNRSMEMRSVDNDEVSVSQMSTGF